MLLTYSDGLAVENLLAPKVEAERAGDGYDHADSAGVARVAGVALTLWDVPCAGNNPRQQMDGIVSADEKQG
jgi:hypothetical protein